MGDLSFIPLGEISLMMVATQSWEKVRTMDKLLRPGRAKTGFGRDLITSTRLARSDSILPNVTVSCDFRSRCCGDSIRLGASADVPNLHNAPGNNPPARRSVLSLSHM